MLSKKSKSKQKIQPVREKALHYFQRARVLQEATDNGMAKCWTCGKIDHVSHMDGGHGISRNHKGTELEPTNCHAQCRICNRYEYGLQYKFMMHISEFYGQDEVDRLNDMDDAQKGNEDALLRLSEEDGRKATRKRDVEYYQEQVKYWKGIYDSLKYKEGK